MLGSAMTARGEIGFLISALADSNGIFEQEDGSTQIFLVVAWAILLCTIVGPLSIGVLARRVKKLEKEGEQRRLQDGGSARAHPLGVWKDI